MAKPRRGRIARRLESAGIDERLKDRIPVTYSYPREPLPDVQTTERQFAAEFSADFPQMAEQWSRICTLHRLLIEKRAALNDPSDLRLAVDLLGAKGFGDARGAQVLVERGYAMASLGPLRAACEVADLMDFLSRSPAEATLWLAEDKRFDNLSWVRERLPVDSTPFYEFLNWGMHANWRFIPHLMRKQGTPLDTHYEIVPGPVRSQTLTPLLSGIAVFEALKVMALLHDHRPDLVSDLWRGEFHSCCARNKALQDDLQLKVKETVALLTAFARITARAQETN